MADVATAPTRHELSEDQVAFYQENGFLHIPNVFNTEEIDTMADELDWQIQTWAGKSAGWSGPWRKVYMDEATEKQSKLIALHDLHPVGLAVEIDLAAATFV